MDSRSVLDRFTFQYGEIKSQRAACHAHRLKVFTFQYGEIKRRTGAAAFQRVATIYIPVWRD